MRAEFHLEGLPPTINNYYRHSKRKVYKKAEARAWQEAAITEINTAWGKRPAYAGAVKLRIIFEVKSRRKWDIDNRIKPLQDCLERARVIANDNQVEILYVERRHGAKTITHMFVEDYQP